MQTTRSADGEVFPTNIGTETAILIDIGPVHDATIKGMLEDGTTIAIARRETIITLAD